MLNKFGVIAAETRYDALFEGRAGADDSQCAGFNYIHWGRGFNSESGSVCLYGGVTGLSQVLVWRCDEVISYLGLDVASGAFRGHGRYGTKQKLILFV